MFRTMIALIVSGVFCSSLLAAPKEFSTGPIVPGFGPVAQVVDPLVTPQSSYRVAFDIAEAAAPGSVNRSMESAARFLNMHGAAGVPAENLKVAVVVHGGAALDLANSERRGEPNPSADLIAALIKAGVTIELCGQTAAYRQIGSEDLLPGVTLALSAMTAHARLQEQGFTLNPF